MIFEGSWRNHTVIIKVISTTKSTDALVLQEFEMEKQVDGYRIIYTLSYTSYQHTLSTHPLSSPYQRTLSPYIPLIHSLTSFYPLNLLSVTAAYRPPLHRSYPGSWDRSTTVLDIRKTERYFCVIGFTGAI